MKETRLRRVVLVGFMGSGKSTVGRLVADQLGWRFVDFDETIEAEAGVSIPDMFSTRGEGHFRSVEQRVADKLLTLERVVLGSGGGWAAKPGRLDELPVGTETFWLRVTAEEALRRVDQQGGNRPLLAGSDALETATRLVEERAPRYARADWAVDTTSVSVEDVTAQILGILRNRYPYIRT